MKQIQIRAVIFQESAQMWCAQCLEHDVSVQADSLPRLVNVLGDTLVSYVELAVIEGREPFDGMPPAPREFFDMFARAHEMPNSNPQVIKLVDAPKIVPEIRVLEFA
jgi:hypothetical protein